jgi:hypothetical protein
VNLTETHWQMLEWARDKPLPIGEDPDAIDELLAAGLLAIEEEELYTLTDAGHDVLAKRLR